MRISAQTILLIEKSNDKYFLYLILGFLFFILLLYFLILLNSYINKVYGRQISKLIFFSFFTFILLTLMTTNPSIDDHKVAVLDHMREMKTKSPISKINNEWEKIGERIGSVIGESIIEKAVRRDNYLLFSLTKILIYDKSINVGFGILGKIFISDFDDIDKQISESSDKLSSNLNSKINIITKKEFDIKYSHSLPKWLENSLMQYQYTDSRLQNLEMTEYIGGLDADRGNIFFIDSEEVVFRESLIETDSSNLIVTKILISGNYKIVLKWNLNNKEGAYQKALIKLYFNDTLQKEKELFMVGW